MYLKVARIGGGFAALVLKSEVQRYEKTHENTTCRERLLYEKGIHGVLRNHGIVVCLCVVFSGHY